MAKKLLLILFFLSNIIVCSNSRKHNDFDMYLPDSWMKLSKETVEFLVTEKNYPSKISGNDNFDYLYQLKSNDTLFSTPYILVCLNNSERLRRGELKSYGSKFYKYDPATDYLWKYNESSLEVIIPTEKGTINVFCYSTKENFPLIKNDFKRIVNSIFVNPDIKYSSNFLLDIPYLEKFIKSINTTNIFFLTIIIALLLSRRIQKKTVK